MNIKECLKEGFLRKMKKDPSLIQKEIEEAEYDLEKAKKALSEGDCKWTIIKAYYSMFHAARAVLFSLGYREKRHFAVAVVLEELVNQGKLESRIVEDFKAMLSSREEADYHYSYPIQTAEYAVQTAKEFLSEMWKLLGRKT